MNSKLVMTFSAISLAIPGLALSFTPLEIGHLLAIEQPGQVQWILQLLGALYFAFAMVNWMAKGAAIGGIYNRPIAIGNFTHFTVGGLAMLKGITGHAIIQPFFWILTILYLVLAVCFGIILFGNPNMNN